MKYKYKIYCFCGYETLSNSPVNNRCPVCGRRMLVQNTQKVFQDIQKRQKYNIEDIFEEADKIMFIIHHYHFGDKIVLYSLYKFLNDRYKNKLFYSFNFAYDFFPEWTMEKTIKDLKNFKLVNNVNYRLEEILNQMNKEQINTTLVFAQDPLFFKEINKRAKQRIMYAEYPTKEIITLWEIDNKKIYFFNMFFLSFLYYKKYNSFFKYTIPAFLKNKSKVNTIFSMIKQNKTHIFIHQRQLGWSVYKNLSNDLIRKIISVFDLFYKNTYDIHILYDNQNLKKINKENVYYYYYNDYSVYDIVYLIDSCSYVITPESAYILLAQALNKQIIGINVMYPHILHTLDNCLFINTNKNTYIKQIYGLLKNITKEDILNGNIQILL